MKNIRHVVFADDNRIAVFRCPVVKLIMIEIVEIFIRIVIRNVAVDNRMFLDFNLFVVIERIIYSSSLKALKPLKALKALKPLKPFKTLKTLKPFKTLKSQTRVFIRLVTKHPREMTTPFLFFYISAV